MQEVLQKKIDRLNSTVRENVTNVRVVKSFVREDFEINKFEKDNADLKNSGMRAVKVMISFPYLSHSKSVKSERFTSNIVCSVLL